MAFTPKNYSSTNTNISATDGVNTQRAEAVVNLDGWTLLDYSDSKSTAIAVKGDNKQRVLVTYNIGNSGGGTGGGSGGTTNYNDLVNKPSINGVELKKGITSDKLGLVDKNQGKDNAGLFLKVGEDGNVTLGRGGSGSDGISEVTHDDSLTGKGTFESPLSIADTYAKKVDIATHNTDTNAHNDIRNYIAEELNGTQDQKGIKQRVSDLESKDKLIDEDIDALQNDMAVFIGVSKDAALKSKDNEFTGKNAFKDEVVLDNKVSITDNTQVVNTKNGKVVLQIKTIDDNTESTYIGGDEVEVYASDKLSVESQKVVLQSPDIKIKRKDNTGKDKEYTNIDEGNIDQYISTIPGTSTEDKYGIEADYCTHYGITFYEANEDIYGPLQTKGKSVYIRSGTKFKMAGPQAYTETSFASGEKYDFDPDFEGDVVLFYAIDENDKKEIKRQFFPVKEIFWQDAEPKTIPDTAYAAWWSPERKSWKFISNEMGNVWYEAGRAGPLASMTVRGDVITSPNYTGYLLFSKNYIDDMYLTHLKDVESNNDTIEAINRNIAELNDEKLNISTAASTYVTKEELQQEVSKVYHPKGSVDTYNDLPSENNKVGDVWDVKDTGKNYVWIVDEGEEQGHWDDIGGTVDLSNYYNKSEVDTEIEEKINSIFKEPISDTNKVLTENDLPNFSVDESLKYSNGGEGTFDITFIGDTATISTNNGLDITANTIFRTNPAVELDEEVVYDSLSEDNLLAKAHIKQAISAISKDYVEKNQGEENAGKILKIDDNGTVIASDETPSGLLTVSHDITLEGDGTIENPLKLSETIHKDLDDAIASVTENSAEIIKLSDEKLSISDAESTYAKKTNLESTNTNVSNISNKVTNIESKIPSAASYDNQMADKAYVKSAINDMAAFYITSDEVGDAFATKASLVEEGRIYYNQGKERTPTRNDYALVSSDETKNGATTRYIYDGRQWAYQWVINNAPLTQDQIDALNSGITNAKIKYIDEFISNTYTKEEVNDAINDVKLPDQTGHTGCLITNGTTASWNDHAPLYNQASGNGVLVVGSTPTPSSHEALTVFGASNSGLTGYQTVFGEGNTFIGNNTTIVGINWKNVPSYTTVIGSYVTNSTDPQPSLNNNSVYFYHGRLSKMLNTNGVIPVERFTGLFNTELSDTNKGATMADIQNTLGDIETALATI